jgi:hypothetical protein
VIEGAHQGHADFRAGKRIFATIGYPDQDWGRRSVMCRHWLCEPIPR